MPIGVTVLPLTEKLMPHAAGCAASGIGSAAALICSADSSRRSASLLPSATPSDTQGHGLLNWSSSLLSDTLSLMFKGSSAVALHEIPTSCLSLEITEGIVIENVNDTIDKMNLLRSHGVPVVGDRYADGERAVYRGTLPAAAPVAKIPRRKLKAKKAPAVEAKPMIIPIFSEGARSEILTLTTCPLIPLHTTWIATHATKTPRPALSVTVEATSEAQALTKPAVAPRRSRPTFGHTFGNTAIWVTAIPRTKPVIIVANCGASQPKAAEMTVK